MDDDFALPKPAEGFQPQILDDMSVEALEAYAKELEDEMARVRKEIGKKSNYRSEADALFGE